MFDPQKAEPVFLEIVKRMSTEAVQVLGDAIRLLIAGDPIGAGNVVAAGRRQVAATDPMQKPLAALQVAILVHRRLEAAGAAIPVERIWLKQEPASATVRETTVSHATQALLMEDIRRQLAAGTSQGVACPACGSASSSIVGSAPLVHAHEGAGSSELARVGLARYLDPAPLVSILRSDIANPNADMRTTLGVASMLAARDRVSVPVARCNDCGLTYVAFAHREVTADEAATAGSTPETIRQAAPGATFVSAFDHGLLPHWLAVTAEIWSGASIYELGCGSGVGLAHYAIAGMRAGGFEPDAARIEFARDILGVAGASDQTSDFDALMPGSVTCAVSDHGLTRLPGFWRNLDTLCKAISDKGHIAVVAPNGELVDRSDTIGGDTYPMLGGRQTICLTPEFLAKALESRGFQTRKVLRSPTRFEDQRFPMDQRDPFTGVPLWSSKTGDFVLLAQRS